MNMKELAKKIVNDRSSGNEMSATRHIIETILLRLQRSARISANGDGQLVTASCEYDCGDESRQEAVWKYFDDNGFIAKMYACDYVRVEMYHTV